MVVFKINDKQVPFPTSYEELTLRQFFALRDNSKNIFGVLEALSGIPSKEWKYKISIEQFEAISPFISFIQNEPPAFDSYLMPDSIEINGNRYAIPEGLGLKTLIQKIAFEDAIRKNLSDVDLIPTALAIYFHPDIDQCDFDEDRLEVCKELILDCKINEAFPIAGFFFEKYKQSLKEKEKNWNTNQAQKNKAQGLKGLKSSAGMERFGLWRGLLIRVSRMFYGWIITRSFLNYGTKKQKATTKEPIKKS